jgi:hypothetical protein
MRLSEWRAKAPNKDAVAPKVVAVIEQALLALGGDQDPECWVAWGDDPGIRYLVLVPTPAGMLQINVRVMVPGEGPRAAGKVVRWARLQLGELAVEIQGGHRLVTFQVENLVLTGADAAADGISAFAQALFAAVDGRVLAPPKPSTRRPTTATKSSSVAKGSSAKGSPMAPRSPASTR